MQDGYKQMTGFAENRENHIDNAEKGINAAVPVISMIVPVYKVPEQFLRKCIESCMSQTFQDMEILLVDEGSPDDCGSICDEYAGICRRIHTYHDGGHLHDHHEQKP